MSTIRYTYPQEVEVKQLRAQVSVGQRRLLDLHAGLSRRRDGHRLSLLRSGQRESTRYSESLLWLL